MKAFFLQLKWQLKLLQKNNIISISLAVTFIYGLILYFLRDVGTLDKILVAMVLNDPSIIGYFFIALALYTEIRHQILSAIFVSPVSLHQLLIAKTLSLSIIGTLCSLALAISVKGFNFDILSYTLGSFGVCALSALLGIGMLTFASEFLKFVMLSIPVFLVFINIPLLQYLGAIDMGFFKYLFPVQGSADLINKGMSGAEINLWYAYTALFTLIPLSYIAAYKLFSKKIVHQ